MLINQPIEINHKILRNRIVMPPMATGKAVHGMPAEQQISYYRERAKATAMIIDDLKSRACIAKVFDLYIF